MIITTVPVGRDFINAYYSKFMYKYRELERTLLAFIQEETAYVLKPKKLTKTHDTLLDTLYSSNFEVIELE